MKKLADKALVAWMAIGTRWLPFTDAASSDLPVGRLLRLAMFQLPIGMAMVLLLGTLNRVMIVELGVPTWLVAMMIAVPILFAPLRALIGHRSDTHISALGWRRIPYMWIGAFMQFGGYTILAPALLLLNGQGHVDGAAGTLAGQAGSALAFALIGFGIHFTQTAGLALMGDLVPDDKRPRGVALFYLMQLVGMILAAITFSFLLRDFTSELLIRVLHGAAVASLALNVIAMWKQEPRDRVRAATVKSAPRPDFMETWRSFAQQGTAKRLLVGVGLGTMGFGMQDVLLEPYGGEVLKLSVPETTLLTGVMTAGTLFGLIAAMRIFARGVNPCRLAAYGAIFGIPAFTIILFAYPMASKLMFVAGAALIGLGAGLFIVGSLSAAMDMATGENRGLVAGAWGAIQATTAGVGIAAGGFLRDAVNGLASNGALGEALSGPATSYGFVYLIEIFLLLLALVVIAPLVRDAGHVIDRQTRQFGLAELPG
ncbi:MAG: BCD family MFS transporter [Anderseniella sp.]|nr:BCD family MFS transporter [Anderseniella sp.]